MSQSPEPMKMDASRDRDQGSGSGFPSPLEHVPPVDQQWYSPSVETREHGDSYPSKDTPLTDSSSARSMLIQWIDSQLSSLPLGPLLETWQDLRKNYGSYFTHGAWPKTPWSQWIPGGGESWHWSDWLNAAYKFLLDEVMKSWQLLGTLVMLTVLSMVLGAIQTAFLRPIVSRVAQTVIVMVLLLLVVNSFSWSAGAVLDAIQRMSQFLLAMLPIMFALLASLGHVGSVTLFHPLIVSFIHWISLGVQYWVIPLLFLATILYVVSSLSSHYSLSQLAKLLHRIGLFSLGTMLTLFLSSLSIQGGAVAVADGVVLRTAKYLTGNFVPVVGHTIAEAADTVAGASLLIKNAIGLAGVVVLLLLCAFPALKIAMIALLYNVAAAVLQPMGESPIIESLSHVGKLLLHVFAALATVGLMFFLAITILLAAGNISLFLR
ncbi:stage III sporulation protein AE [Pasteuria penetrans]|uniref:stage III sporulation protein AE n=1 Tax=Pasteuria penetrans TaxID=86005 RepID=UPI001CAA526C|nr:stage III sporulation protein AE [Pasteuria penetrans]